MRSLFVSALLGFIALGSLCWSPESASAQTRMILRNRPPPIFVRPPIMSRPIYYYPPQTYSYPSYGYQSSYGQYSNMQSDTVNVGAYDTYFTPNTITIRPGMTVKWTNYGNHKHTVTSDDGQWDSGDMNPNTVYSWTFPVAGIYHFHCKHHQGMIGTIVVTEKSYKNRGGGSGGY
jgi:plastocyanin